MVWKKDTTFNALYKLVNNACMSLEDIDLLWWVRGIRAYAQRIEIVIFRQRGEVCGDLAHPCGPGVFEITPEQSLNKCSRFSGCW